jgi:hypothetical protein
MFCKCGNPITEEWEINCSTCTNAFLRANVDTESLGIGATKRLHTSYRGQYSSILASGNPKLRRFGWEYIIEHSNLALLLEIAQTNIDRIDNASN